MKKARRPAAFFVLSLCLLLPGGASAQGTTRIVDDDGRASSTSCESGAPAPSSIQAAIDLSASGDIIYVCPGVYEEQLKIVGKILTIRGVTSSNQNLVLVKPNGMVANSTNAYSGAAVAAIVAVEDSSGVVLRNLTFDGIDNRLTGCNPLLVGIFYRNASGDIQATAVRDTRLADGNGCQSGIGVFAQSSGGIASRVTISGSSIQRYQKAGIVGNEVGTEFLALDNAVGGDEATSPIARNGIQIGFGATGRIAGNTIVNHVRTCAAFSCDVSTSVLVFEADGITVSGNNASKAVMGIYLVRSNGSLVRSNVVFDSHDRDGIAVVGNSNRIQLNSIGSSDEFGLYVEGNGNRLDRNTINEASCGIYAATSNILAGNSIFNTQLAICEPFSLARQALDSKGTSSSTLGLAIATSGMTIREATPVR
jgi:parallel beta-helix repeat protein